MEKIIQNGKVTEVILDPQEFRAFEIISTGKSLNLPTKDTFKKLEAEGISDGKFIRAGSQAFEFEKKGALISKGGGFKPRIRTKSDFFEPRRGRARDRAF
tara:strand:- start:5024 stop:5323 length:300 start_codon:yes stop_codon:yes gene_type:complete